VEDSVVSESLPVQPAGDGIEALLGLLGTSDVALAGSSSANESTLPAME
jgi:hypothetical protein